MSHLLKIESLSITAKKSKADIVKDISFAIPKNKVTCIIGESGCGKTMTAKAIIGLLDTRKFDISGKILYKDKDLLTNINYRSGLMGSDITFIMQNPMTAFNPSVKVGSQIIETIRTHKDVSKKEAFTMGVKSLTGMALPRPEHIMNAYPYTLSGGMLQRCMIAISLLFHPNLIISDESTTAVDVKNQETILGEFLKLRDKGMTLIFITHDFSVVSKISDYVVVMQHGRIVEQGETNKVFNNPKHEHTKELLKARLLNNGDNDGRC